MEGDNGEHQRMTVRRAVPEAPSKATEEGRVVTGDGWFVVNARDVRWRQSNGMGLSTNLGGEILFDQLGLGLRVLAPGEPMAMYHWETDQEDFLVLAGEATLIIEGQERTLTQWDFVHCPPGAAHVIVGAGDSPCVVFTVGSRERHTMIGDDGVRTGRPDWGEYVADSVAQKYGAAPNETTTSADEAYARFPPPQFTGYGGWLPD